MELLVRLLREFERDYNRFVLEGVASVVTRFEVFSSYAHGKRVRVSNGTESYLGTTAGLGPEGLLQVERDRKSTRLNSSHGYLSHAVFCLKKKNPIHRHCTITAFSSKAGRTRRARHSSFAYSDHAHLRTHDPRPPVLCTARFLRRLGFPPH